ncbi:MAG: colanic acid biosynthesis glycosyl transferase WcaI [Solirubrobacterales bacterium]|jgi:colanic acid biosynthesis glycosyl transferase WcaI|nr:colanic acid biosynthesis glycosyl transferase WcaI [Solirubrobacterales bacterium]
MPRRVQLWSANFAPEPTGIAPVSTVLADELAARGWEVDVVANHPHYPDPRWGARRWPYRQRHGDMKILRLPLLIGRETAKQRLLQEMSIVSSYLAATPILGPPLLRKPDVLLVVSPPFPALLAAVINGRLRGLPWVYWMHDLLPDGAVSTGFVDEDSRIMRASRWLERKAYEECDSVAVLSQAFADNVLAKGVPPEKVDLIYDPATRPFPDLSSDGAGPAAGDEIRILSMGNIGLTQGLAPLVAAFERSEEIAERKVKLVITGNGVAAADVEAEIRSDRVEYLGLVSDERLEQELRSATLALVSQSHEGAEFNLPSKLMNFMAYGLPIVAAVNPGGETARLVEKAEAGWIADSSVADLFPQTVISAIADADDLQRKAQAARAYAEKSFSREAFAGSFDRLLKRVAATGTED